MPDEAPVIRARRPPQVAGVLHFTAARLQGAQQTGDPQRLGPHASARHTRPHIGRGTHEGDAGQVHFSIVRSLGPIRMHSQIDRGPLLVKVLATSALVALAVYGLRRRAVTGATSGDCRRKWGTGPDARDRAGDGT